MLTFRKFLDLKEELTPEQKEHVSNWHRDPEAIKHTDHYFGVGNDERHEPLEGTMNKSEIHRQVERHLKREIPHEDYKAGYTTDEHQRKVKIGGLLQKTKAPKELLDNMKNGYIKYKDLSFNEFEKLLLSITPMVKHVEQIKENHCGNAEIQSYDELTYEELDLKLIDNLKIENIY